MLCFLTGKGPEGHRKDPETALPISVGKQYKEESKEKRKYNTVLKLYNKGPRKEK
jgi:hypothetical protein